MKAEQLEQYIEAKQALVDAKANEAELRMAITDELLAGKSEGTHNFKIDGMKVKAVNKMNYKIDEDELDTIWDDLEQAEQDLVRFKPSLKLKDYKEAEGDLMLNNAITVSPAMPTLEVSHGD